MHRFGHFRFTDFYKTWQEYVNFFVAKFLNMSVQGSLFPQNITLRRFYVPSLRVRGVATQGLSFKTIGSMLSDRGHAKDVPFL